MTTAPPTEAPSPFDWAGHYRRGETPWDLGRPHPELAARLTAEPWLNGSGRRAVVPGCGRGHDALALADHGFAVTALDLVADLTAVVGPPLAQRGGQLLITDALEFQPERPFDLLWEHTFLSALAPSRDAAYGRMARHLVAPGGYLAAVGFPADKPETAGGPPYRTDRSRLAAALGDGFEWVAEGPVGHPAGTRQYAEQWLVLRRRQETA